MFDAELFSFVGLSGQRRMTREREIQGKMRNFFFFGISKKKIKCMYREKEEEEEQI